MTSVVIPVLPCQAFFRQCGKKNEGIRSPAKTGFPLRSNKLQGTKGEGE
jgi:hypothetical protein